MPVFVSETTLACSVERAWEFFIRPRNVELVSPPDLNLRVAEGPEFLFLGATVTVTVRRWGVSQRLVNEVTAFEPPTALTDEQRQGPFRKWIHRHRLTIAAEGVHLMDEIEFEPPGGLLGFVLPATEVERELREVFAYRTVRLKELLGVERSSVRS